MEFIVNIFKVIVLSIVEGVTEFLPVSSTGHLILVNDLVKLSPDTFANAFNVIIQLGAILSVVVVFFDRLNPFSEKKMSRDKLPQKYGRWNKQTKLYYRMKHYDKQTVELWKKVIIGVLPAVVLGLLFDDYIDEHLMNTQTVTITLILYGIAIIAIEVLNGKKKSFKFETADDLDYKTALIIGLFQCLAMVPGTSRSAATIIGAMILGSSRFAAAEFSFFLAIPTMVGATLLKILKNIGAFSGSQWLLVLIGFVLSYIVAYVVIKKFMNYIQKHDFKIFGYYRLVLGAILLITLLF